MNPFIDFAFLDSGTGGIPYMLALKEKCPEARCVYLGDSAHFPYGEKSSQEIISCSSEAVRTIVEKWNPRTIVIACNTISVTALEVLRSQFPGVPIVGTVPAIRLAARVTRNGRIGFLATNAAVNHPYSAQLVKDYAGNCQVFSRGDPDLISFIEHSYFNATEEQRFAAVKPATDFFASHECDTIILGCTHFTHIAKEFAQAAGPLVRVIDSREGVANQALLVEQEYRMHPAGADCNGARSSLPSDMSFFVSGYRSPDDPAEYASLCRHFNIPWGGMLS